MAEASFTRALCRKRLALVQGGETSLTGEANLACARTYV